MSEKEKTAPPTTRPATPSSTWCCQHTDPLHKVTIIPRGPYLGATMYLPEGDKYSTQKKEALDQPHRHHGRPRRRGVRLRRRDQRCLRRHPPGHRARPPDGLRVGHERGTRHGRIRRGRSPGLPRPRHGPDPQLLRGDRPEDRRRDQASHRRGLPQGGDHPRAHRDKLDLIAKALLEYETLDGSHIKDIIEHGEMKDPPKGAQPPTCSASRIRAASRRTASVRTASGRVAPELAGAPA